MINIHIIIYSHINLCIPYKNQILLVLLHYQNNSDKNTKQNKNKPSEIE